MLLEKGVLKIGSKFTGEHPCRSAISELQSNFIEITLRHGCSPANLVYNFGTPFLKSTSGWLLPTKLRNDNTGKYLESSLKRITINWKNNGCFVVFNICSHYLFIHLFIYLFWWFANCIFGNLIALGQIYLAFMLLVV